MKRKILEQLIAWRRGQAEREGIEPWRVLMNESLIAVAETQPKTKEELMQIKGIKELKCQKYGMALLAVVAAGGVGDLEDVAGDGSGGDAFGSGAGRASANAAEPDPHNGAVPVGKFLAAVNSGLEEFRGRVIGEVTSVDARANCVYFKVKDKSDQSVLSCFAWNRQYDLSGVALQAGLEVIVGGMPQIYKPTGGFTFQVQTIELVGEGALKKAYDALRRKLDDEGIFSPERKRPLPQFPERIGLITSRTGAVIHDFLNNLGKFGYQIQFADSRVEGQSAVADLLAALGHFELQHERGKGVDVLVIIRGGGSLESLLAFNNELVVRKIASMPFPVIAGIGHDKDVPLAALAADLMVSTPTAVTHALNASWQLALGDVLLAERNVLGRYQESLVAASHQLDRHWRDLEAGFNQIFVLFNSLSEKLSSCSRMCQDWIASAADRLDGFARVLDANDPLRQLRLGYSIAWAGKDGAARRIVRRIADAKPGESLEIQVADGTITTDVKDTKKHAK